MVVGRNIKGLPITGSYIPPYNSLLPTIDACIVVLNNYTSAVTLNIDDIKLV